MDTALTLEKRIVSDVNHTNYHQVRAELASDYAIKSDAARTRKYGRVISYIASALLKTHDKQTAESYAIQTIRNEIKSKNKIKWPWWAGTLGIREKQILELRTKCNQMEKDLQEANSASKRLDSKAFWQVVIPFLLAEELKDKYL